MSVPCDPTITICTVTATVSNAWYNLSGIIDLGLISWGGWIYYIYNYNLSSGTDKTLHPYKEWTYESYCFVGTYGFFFVYWLINLILGHNGGFLDHISIFLGYLQLLAPIGTLYGAFHASSSYGTATEVALGTDWAFTVNDDPNYTLMFSLSLLISVMDLIWEYMSLGSLKESYNEKVQ